MIVTYVYIVILCVFEFRFSNGELKNMFTC